MSEVRLKEKQREEGERKEDANEQVDEEAVEK